MAEKTTETLIIGGGIAGLVAARELSNKGIDVTILESRDRLGGRVWAQEHWGRNLEIGGTWIHWTQPYVWAETTRYGLEVTRGPVLKDAYWLEQKTNAKGEKEISVRRGTAPELLDLIDDGMTKLLAETRKWLPRPDRPLDNADSEGFASVDAETLGDRLDSIDIPESELLPNEAAWVGHLNCDPHKASFTAGLRWTTASAGDWHLMHEATAVYRLKDSTAALVQALVKDSDADVYLSTKALSVTQTSADEVEVRTNNGDTWHAQNVIITVPLNVVADIEVTPPPPAELLEVSREKMASRGVKVWIRVKGPITPFYAYGSAQHPLSVLRTEYVGEDDAVVVGFGADIDGIDPNDRDAVQAAINVWRDDLEVLDCTGHNWIADEHSKETWLIQKPGQFTKTHRTYQQPLANGLIHYAGADNANVWTGFIDGAIESALRVSQIIIDEQNWPR